MAIDPVAFSIFDFEVRWYGISYVVSFILALFYAVSLSKRYNVLILQSKRELITGNKSGDFPSTSSLLETFLTWAVCGVIIGGRLGNCLFYDFLHYITNPLEIIMIRKGGMSFHGGVLGVLVALFLFCKKYKVHFLKLADIVATVVPIGLFLGRISNFINQEVYGRPTHSRFGVVFEKVDTILRHPSQLYEAFLEGLVLFVALRLLFPSLHKTPGVLSGFFLMLYGFFRFGVEYVREPDGIIQVHNIDLLSYGQLLSLPMIMSGFFLIFYCKSKQT